MIHYELAWGGAIALGFDGEEDLAVFLPGPADVFRCAKSHWRALVGESPMAAGTSVDGPKEGFKPEDVLALKAALVRSGAHLS